MNKKRYSIESVRLLADQTRLDYDEARSNLKHRVLMEDDQSWIDHCEAEVKRTRALWADSSHYFNVEL